MLLYLHFSNSISVLHVRDINLMFNSKANKLFKMYKKNNNNNNIAEYFMLLYLHFFYSIFVLYVEDVNLMSVCGPHQKYFNAKNLSFLVFT